MAKHSKNFQCFVFHQLNIIFYPLLTGQSKWGCWESQFLEWRTTEAAVHSWPWSSGWCLRRSSGWPWCPLQWESLWHTGVRCTRWWSSCPWDVAWRARTPSSPTHDRSARCCPTLPHTAGFSARRNCGIHGPSTWATPLSTRSHWTCSATRRHRVESHQSHLEENLLLINEFRHPGRRLQLPASRLSSLMQC